MMRLGLPLVALGAVLCLALVPFAAPWLQFVVTMALAKGFAALGVMILLRAGLISIGHAMFFAVSAYAAAFLARAGIGDFALLLVLATLAAGVFGALAGAFLVRYRAIFFAMLNLALSMVLYALVSKFYAITGGSDGLGLSTPRFFGLLLNPGQFDRALYYTALTLMVGVGALVARYLRSPLGYALLAVHGNELRLEYLGVSARGVLLIAYVVSAVLAGVGGVIMACAVGHVLPEFAFWTASGHLVLVAVLGGVGSVAGPFIGSLFLELLHSAVVGLTDAWNLITGVALIAVIFLLPSGLQGLMRRRAGDGL